MDVALWQIYRFQDDEVMVSQLWCDSFGRKMVRIEATAPGDERGEGMPEEVFLQFAVLVRDAPC